MFINFHISIDNDFISITISNVKVLSRVKFQLNNGSIAAIDLAQMVDPWYIEIERMMMMRMRIYYFFFWIKQLMSSVVKIKTQRHSTCCHHWSLLTYMENKRSLAQKSHEIRMDSNETNPLFGFSRFLILKNLFFCFFFFLFFTVVINNNVRALLWMSSSFH